MKRIAILAVVAMGLAGLAVLAVPFLVSPDLLRHTIADRIAGATGGAVKIAGEPGLSVYPHLAVSASGVVIADPHAVSDGALIEADKITARVRLLPLLLGRVEFDGFELVRPRIHVIANEQGVANWRLARAGDDASPQLTRLAVGRLQIVDGTIVYDNLATHQHAELAAVDLSLTWPLPGAPLSGDGSAQWRDEKVEFNGSAANLLDLINGNGTAVRFAIASTSLRVSFNGKLLGGSEQRLEGDTSITTPSLRGVVEWLGTPMGNGSILGPASIEGTMSWLGSSITFSKASVGLDGNEAQGVLSIDRSGARPVLQGTFAASKLDLSPYLEAMRADMSADGPWPFAATALPLADALDLDLRFSAGQMLLGALRLDNLGATTTIKDGVITTNVGQASFYGGTLSARIAASMHNKALTGSLHAQLTSVPAAAPLGDLLSVTALSGTANATFDIAGHGETWGSFVRSIAGNADVEIAGGTITGIDVHDVAARMADPLAEPMIAGTGTTAFAELAGKLAVEGGTLSAKDLTVEGTDYTLVLNGSSSLLTGSLDARAKLAMTTGKDPAVPVAITGTWRAPLIGPDQPAEPPQGVGQPRG